MDRVTVAQRQEIVKASTDRLRARLIRAGYNEATVMSYSRHELMEAYAEYSLLMVPPVEPQGAFAGVGVGAPAEQDDPVEENVPGEPEIQERPDVAEAAEMTELELRRRELWLREKELKRQKEKEKAERELRKMELDLRKMELDRQRETVSYTHLTLPTIYSV